MLAFVPGSKTRLYFAGSFVNVHCSTMCGANVQDSSHASVYGSPAPKLREDGLIGERRAHGVHGSAEDGHHEEALQCAVDVARVAQVIQPHRPRHVLRDVKDLEAFAVLTITYRITPEIRFVYP